MQLFFKYYERGQIDIQFKIIHEFIVKQNLHCTMTAHDEEVAVDSVAASLKHHQNDQSVYLCKTINIPFNIVLAYVQTFHIYEYKEENSTDCMWTTEEYHTL